MTRSTRTRKAVVRGAAAATSLAPEVADLFGTAGWAAAAQLLAFVDAHRGQDDRYEAERLNLLGADSLKVPDGPPKPPDSPFVPAFLQADQP